MSHRLLILIHVLLAGFLLPTTILFTVTGGLYTWGVKGDYSNTTINKNLQLPADPGIGELTEMARTLLREDFQAAEPSGKASIKKVGTSWQLEWTGSRADFILGPTTESGVYKATYKRVNPHRLFVQLHKAKGGWPFKVLAASFALGMLLILGSGVLMALRQTRLRGPLLASLAAGSIVLIIAIAFS